MAIWLGTLAVEWLRFEPPFTRLLEDVLKIYKLVTYIPVMFLNPFLEAGLKFIYHNI